MLDGEGDVAEERRLRLREAVLDGVEVNEVAHCSQFIWAGDDDLDARLAFLDGDRVSGGIVEAGPVAVELEAGALGVRLGSPSVIESGSGRKSEKGKSHWEARQRTSSAAT